MSNREPRNLWAGHSVLLRAWEEDDAAHQLAAASDRQVERLANEVSLPQSERAIREGLNKTPEAGSDNCQLAVTARDTGEVVGGVNVHGANRRHRHFYYGIGIERVYWRRGYAAEAVTLLLRYYFRELGYHYAIAEVYAFNVASVALHRHLGFSEEGRFREALFADGRFHDELVFGMLDREFAPLEQRLPAVPLVPGDE